MYILMDIAIIYPIICIWNIYYRKNIMHTRKNSYIIVRRELGTDL